MLCVCSGCEQSWFLVLFSSSLLANVPNPLPNKEVEPIIIRNFCISECIFLSAWSDFSARGLSQQAWGCWTFWLSRYRKCTFRKFWIAQHDANCYHTHHWLGPGQSQQWWREWHHRCYDLNHPQGNVADEPVMAGNNTHRPSNAHQMRPIGKQLQGFLVSFLKFFS